MVLGPGVATSKAGSILHSPPAVGVEMILRILSVCSGWPASPGSRCSFVARHPGQREGRTGNVPPEARLHVLRGQPHHREGIRVLESDTFGRAACPRWEQVRPRRNDAGATSMRTITFIAGLVLGLAAMTSVAPDALGQAVSPTIPKSVAKTQKPPLHGQHWMAITGKPLAATAGAMMFQRGGNAVDAACAMIAATSTMWDTSSWGGETQALVYDPRSKKVDRDQRPRRRADRRDAGVLSRQGLRLSARVRTARGRDARHARRADADARGIRHDCRSPTCSRPRSSSPTATRSTPRPRTRSSAGRRQAEGVAVFEAGDAAAPRRGARGAARGRDLPPAGPRRDAAQARRGRAAGARRRQVAQGRDPGRLRPLLQGRHRAGVRARRAGTGRADHAGRPRELEAAASRSRCTRTIAASRSTSSTPGRRGRRCCRRSTSSRTSTCERWATTARATSTPCTRR